MPYICTVKKVLSISLLLTYLCFNTGLAVSVHYCGGNFSSFSLIGAEKKTCACGKKKMANKCCKNVKTTLSSSDDQQISQSNYSFSGFNSFVPSISEFHYHINPVYVIINSNTTRFYVFEHGPPKTAIYIQVHALLI